MDMLRIHAYLVEGNDDDIVRGAGISKYYTHLTYSHITPYIRTYVRIYYSSKLLNRLAQLVRKLVRMAPFMAANVMTRLDVLLLWMTQQGQPIWIVKFLVLLATQDLHVMAVYTIPSLQDVCF